MNVGEKRTEEGSGCGREEDWLGELMWEGEDWGGEWVWEDEDLGGEWM